MTVEHIPSKAGPFRRTVARVIACVGSKLYIRLMKKRVLDGIEVRTSSQWMADTERALEIVRASRPSALQRLARARYTVICVPLQTSISFPLRVASLNLRSPAQTALDLVGISRAIQVFPAVGKRDERVERVIDIVLREMRIVRARIDRAGLFESDWRGHKPAPADEDKVAVALWNESVINY